uniref:Helicase ATP-binding domain-containing protein n=1 Tax=viral metagenome TaxID=1070528 RepID=A0A6C0BKF1_9ZZZZ
MESLDKVITIKGYAIRKGSLDEKQIKYLKDTLTVTPAVKQKYMKKEELDALRFYVYKESPTRYYVPRSWGITTYGPAEANLVPEGLPLSTEAAIFGGKPYPYQEDIIQKFMDAGMNGLICVPCGKGKTFMALSIAAKIGRRFLVVVDKEFLMNQWKGEIQSLFPNLRIGILQAGRHELEPELYDCTLCMIQTLCSQTFPSTTFQNYGFTIFDECHHLGAAHFSRALVKIQTKYMLGLSATPKRDDGLTKVFEWFLGEPVYWEKTREPDPEVLVRPVMLECSHPDYLKLPMDWRGEVVTARLLTQIVQCKERNEIVAKLLRELCENEHRRVLVLSERIGHLNEFERLLEGSGLSISYYIGGMKEEVREEGAKTARILLASYAMASEAMNIKTLNTVVLASPRKKVEQSTGRILRIRASERQVPPLIVDLVDVHNIYKNQYRQRLIYYRKCKYTIEGKKQETSAEIRVPTEDGCLLADD